MTAVETLQSVPFEEQCLRSYHDPPRKDPQMLPQSEGTLNLHVHFTALGRAPERFQDLLNVTILLQASHRLHLAPLEQEVTHTFELRISHEGNGHSVVFPAFCPVLIHSLVPATILGSVCPSLC